MKHDSDTQKFPWWAIPLIALASFRFDYHWESGSHFSYNGAGIAIIVISIISLVMVFAVTKHIQQVLKAHNLISKLPKSQFWSLLPLVILLPGIGYRAISDVGFTDKFSDKYIDQWDFRWGASPLNIWLTVGTLVIIFLHTIILTLKEMERSEKNKSEQVAASDR